MALKRNTITSVSPTDGAPHVQLPFTPLPMVPPTDGVPHLAYPPTSLSIDQDEHQKEVSRPFGVYDEKTQSISIASQLTMQSKSRQSFQRSYYPTGWAFADRILDIADTLTRGRADWFQRLFSFLFVGGLGAVVNLICFSIVYNLLIQSINSLVAFLIAFISATEVSIVTNFVLNDRITFRIFHSQTRSWQLRCVRFHITSIGGTLLTLGISFFLLHLMHVSALLSQATALLIATAFNFVFHHIFTYRHERGHTVTAHSNQLARENIVVGP